MDKKNGSDPHPSPISPPPAPRTSTSLPPRTSISPPQRVSTPSFIDTQAPLPELELSTPPPSSSATITFEQVRDLVSLLSETFTSQLQNIQNQNTKLKNEMQGLKVQNSELKE